MTKCDILIVGAGAAGLAAAIGALNSRELSVLIVDGASCAGGILPQCLHSGFGKVAFGEELMGPDFLDKLMKELPPQAKLRLETTVLNIKPDRTAILSSPSGIEYVRFDQLILATGCKEASIWTTDTIGTRPVGVFTAGMAQKLVNLKNVRFGKRIVIVGSGDVGLVMAGRFAELGNKPLAVIEKRPQLGGLKRNQKRFIEAYDIPVMLSSVVEEIHGEKILEGVTIRHLDDGSSEYISCDLLITALGLIPDKKLVEGLMQDNALPEYIHLAGNCDYVHDLVDTVIRNASRIGEKAAGLCVS